MAEMKFIVVLVLSLCAIFPLSLATSNDFQYCNKKKNYDVNVTGVDITPYPIQRSVDTTTFTISASTDKSISSGKLRVEVKYFFFSVYSEDHDLCSETSCPIPAGDFAIAHTQALPGITPPGSYTLTMKVKDDKNNELSCINFDFSIGFLAEEPKAVADS